MKFWNSYGSEHSNNLVMIGQFKSTKDAQAAKDAIDKIKEHFRETQESYEESNRFSQPLLDILMKVKMHSLHPRELDQFNYDVKTELKGDKIVVTTEESDFSAFLKILIDYGAKVEAYSGHVYKGTGEGR